MDSDVPYKSSMILQTIGLQVEETGERNPRGLIYYSAMKLGFVMEALVESLSELAGLSFYP